jgi:fibronectin type 3 domain-containing protein
VALYAVYRAAGAGTPVRVGTTLASNTTFVDREVRPGATYRYAVTAIDDSRTPNESERSNEVTVSMP